MNNYQKALNKIVQSSCPNCHDENGCLNCNIKHTCNALAKDWVNKLQKLIDKATPKKTIIKNVCNEVDGDVDYGACPNCEYPLNYDFNYCPDCGQALDWNNTNENKN